MIIDNKLPKSLRKVTIRRYLDFEKFISLLTTKSLYFANPNQFSDKLDCYCELSHELTRGLNHSILKELYKKDALFIIKNLLKVKDSVPSSARKFNGYDINLEIEIYSSLLNFLLADNRYIEIKYLDDEVKSQIKHIVYIISKGNKKNYNIAESILSDIMVKIFPVSFSEIMRENTFISCWTKEPFESDLLWRIFSAKNGFAIETTVNKLEQEIDFTPENDVTLYISDVRYEEPVKLTSHEDINDPIKLWFTKRPVFKDEHEIRFVVTATKSKITRDEKGGCQIKLKDGLADFIDRIIVSPYKKENLYLIKKLLCDMNQKELAEKVVCSEIQKVK